MKIRFGIHIKYTILVIIPLVLIAGSVIAFLSLNNKKRALIDAQSLVNASTKEYANKIKASIDYEIGLMQSISFAISDFESRPFSKIEEIFSYELRTVLSKTETFLSTHAYWELGEINNSYKKDHGRVRFTYLNLDGNITLVRDTLDLEFEDKSGLYYKLKKLNTTMITKPYFDNYGKETNIKMASLVIPTNSKNGKWVGNIGADIRMERFNHMIDQIQLFKGYSFIVSNDGTIISHPNRDLVGALLTKTKSTDDKEMVFSELSISREPFHFFSNNYPDKKQRYISFAPIEFKGIKEPWFLAISVPVSEITKEAEKNFIISIIIGASGIILIIILIWLLSGYITEPLKETTKVLNKISSGHISDINPISIKSSDEIGQMSTALNKLTVSLKNITDFASDIGQGNFDTTYTPLSKNDILGNSLVRMQTDLKITRKELANSMQKVESATKSKSIFLANMSHEIRTPLNSIIGIVGLLLETDPNKKQREYLNIISNSGESLLAIINDVLDFSKIESEQLKLEKIPFSIKDAVGQVRNLFIYQAENKKLYIDLSIADNIPEKLIGDPTRLKQILTNLLGNAIKFTDKGGVSITISLSESGSSTKTILFEVEDTGIGISESGMKKLFGEYSQTDTSTAREFGGTGLGLSITQKLVNLMNGKINVQSELGKGSRFYFQVRFGIDNKESTKNQINKKDELAPLSYKKLNILIAEDNPINVKVISLILKKQGHTLDVAENGEIVLEKFNSNTKYDIILMDIQMPKMNGIETTREIRKLESKDKAKKRIPIVAVTANAVIGDRERFLSADMDNYISKPFKPDNLERIIQELCK